jgi:hypothetical protein
MVDASKKKESAAGTADAPAAASIPLNVLKAIFFS